ncbi:hypothetical protein M9Y10_028225 [Tritrichomonas musculus]|uniref:F-BAR domain-containing protein n=1 Tax=Tritrichomonas musculus TaxID=1915356 RepID=A0ABR2KIU8_9EUKA
MRNRCTVPPELLQAQNDAIHNLNFEVADNISKQILEYQRQSYENFQNTIYAKVNEDSDAYSHYYDQECESITLRQEMEARNAKAEFRKAAKQLADKFRKEARDLEKKWRHIYDQAIEDAESRTQTAKISARILAKCDMYSTAISVRDSIKPNDMKCAKECCESFQRQYKLMTERHEQEFDHLHSLIKNYMTILKNQCEQMKIAADTAKIADETESSVNAINSVLQKTNNDSIRKSIIDKYSPKIAPSKKKRTTRKINSSINSNRLSEFEYV